MEAVPRAAARRTGMSRREKERAADPACEAAAAITQAGRGAW